MTTPPQGPSGNNGMNNQWNNNNGNSGRPPQQPQQPSNPQRPQQPQSGQQWQGQQNAQRGPYGQQPGQYGQPQGQYGQLQGQYGQPQGQYGQPQRQANSQQQPWQNSGPVQVGAAYGSQQPEEKKGKKKWLALLAVILLAFVAGAAWLTGGFGLFRGEAPTYEARFDTDRQFLGDFANTEADLDAVKLRSLAKELDAPTGDVVGSDARGIYGTSGDADACEASELANLFVDEAEYTADFAEVLGEDPSEMSSYIMQLTSTYLARDTWVTNYYVNDDGGMDSYQSVMEAGTAVLVDSYGVPRVRCASGSPLEERDEELADPRSGEPSWDDYNGRDVVSIAPGDEIDELPYIDVENGDVRQRPLGAGRTGAVQVQLTWDTRADMDLHVETASGDEIYWLTEYADGGSLDVDMCIDGESGGCGDEGNIENVFWEDSAPAGEYSAWVENFNDNGYGSVDFKLRVFVEGVKVDEIEGSLEEDDVSSSIYFDVEG